MILQRILTVIAQSIQLQNVASTAGPYLLITLAEASGGSATDIEPGSEILKANKDNVKQWYLASSDVQKAFSAGEIGVDVFMDMNIPSLLESGLNVKWMALKRETSLPLLQSMLSRMPRIRNLPNCM